MGNSLGCDPNFDWRDYVSIIKWKADDDKISQLENALDFISATPEGQAILKQGKEVNGTLFISALDDIKGENTGTKTFDLGLFDVINISFSELSSLDYPTQEGSYAKVSLIHAMYHELFHYADADTTDINSREDRAVEGVNVFLSKYLPMEPLRAEYSKKSISGFGAPVIAPPTEVPSEVMQQCTLDNLDPGAIPALLPASQKTK